MTAAEALLDLVVDNAHYLGADTVEMPVGGTFVRRRNRVFLFVDLDANDFYRLTMFGSQSADLEPDVDDEPDDPAEEDDPHGEPDPDIESDNDTEPDYVTAPVPDDPV